LAYKLQLPDDWRIHPVVSVSQLEPAKSDPFEREIAPPPAVDVDGEEQWEIDSIIRGKLRGRGRNRRRHYLVRWKGYGPEVDSWIPAEEMEHTATLVEEFERHERDLMDVAVVG
jgi:hypothetical protein